MKDSVYSNTWIVVDKPKIPDNITSSKETVTKESIIRSEVKRIETGKFESSSRGSYPIVKADQNIQQVPSKGQAQKHQSEVENITQVLQRTRVERYQKEQNQQCGISQPKLHPQQNESLDHFLKRKNSLNSDRSFGYQTNRNVLVDF